jgi:hypothetical protein
LDKMTFNIYGCNLFNIKHSYFYFTIPIYSYVSAFHTVRYISFQAPPQHFCSCLPLFCVTASNRRCLDRPGLTKRLTMCTKPFSAKIIFTVKLSIKQHQFFWTAMLCIYYSSASACRMETIQSFCTFCGCISIV